MLQAHSLIWHYLWVAPHVLQLGLALLLWRRGLHRRLPVFFCFLIFEALEEFVLYGLDLAPSVHPQVWWDAFCTGVILEGLFRFAVIAELLQLLLRDWPSLARTGRNVVGGFGAFLILFASVAAAIRDPGNAHWMIISAHLLQQTFYITQAGLILSIFLLAAYFHVVWSKLEFGIALGFGIAWCEHLAAWAVTASGAFENARNLFDLGNMATYHVAVLIWIYYLLAPEPASLQSSELPADHHLETWNRELERLLQL